jgi:hypothetical protein
MKQAGIRFEPKQKCLPPMQRSGGSAEDGRFPNGGRSHPVWAQVDQPVDSFLSSQERREAGCWHQLFFAQVEYCENLIFRSAQRWMNWGTDCSTPIAISAGPTS